jgi:deoxyribodipyrimidine photolyase
MSALLSFRRDLRLSDHPAPPSAYDAAENQEVLACSVLDPRPGGVVGPPHFRKWHEIGRRAPARSGADSARWLDPAQVALAHWAAFVDDGLDRYAEDRDRPDLEGTSRMSAHLKFGTIHPRTMVAGLNLRRTGAQTYLRELAFRDFYAAVLHCWPASAWHNWNSEFDNIQIETGAQAKRRFKSWKADETGFGWSVRGCGSCARPASCTTGCG